MRPEKIQKYDHNSQIHVNFKGHTSTFRKTKICSDCNSIPGQLTCSCPSIHGMWHDNLAQLAIDHFTVVCLVAWSLNESEAGVNLALMETAFVM